MQFTNSTDLLNISGTNSADPQTIHDCMKNLISNLKLEVTKFKSIFIRWSACNAWFQRKCRCKIEKTPELETFVECSLRHRLPLACADSSNHFLKKFEVALRQLSVFSNNSSMRLNVYLNTAHKMHNMETLPDNKRQNVVNKSKKRSLYEMS